MNNFVYYINKKIYINLTNECSNDCAFCIRRTHDGMQDKNLWLDTVPTADDVIEQLPENLEQWDDEVVFCGFGEPCCNLDTLLEVADFLHCKNKTTRINTNGQGNLICGRDITTDIVDTCDVVNVSLNASTKEKYQALCKSKFGSDAFDEMIDFAKKIKAKGGNVVFSVVDCIGKKEIQDCQALANKHKIPLRVRIKQ